MKLLALLVVAATLVFVGCERKIINEVASDPSLFGCFGCHGETSFDGALLQARGEWQNSVHASGTSIDYTNRGGLDCTQCHNHQGFLEYLETGQVSAPFNVVSAIHCFTCHAPHERGDLTLRTAEPYTLKNGVVFDHGAANLCANCHHVRTALTAAIPVGVDSVQINNRFGPHHGPQADLLKGTHGFHHPGYTYTQTGHINVVREGCIGCHMGNPQQHDGYNIGGHSMNMVYKAHDGTTYSLVGICMTCHTSFAAARNFNQLASSDIDGDGVIEGIQDECDGLRDSLAVLLAPLLTKQANGTYVPKTMRVRRDVAGAVWNLVSYQEDRSRGIHNPNYIISLLKNSINYMLANPLSSTRPEDQFAESH